jgi:hypothetical protein
MKSLQWSGAALLTLAFVLPVSAQDKKKDKKNIEVLDAEKVLKPGKYSGKVMAATESSLRLRVESTRFELKPGRKPNSQLQHLAQLEQRLARAQQHLLTARNANDQARAVQEIQNLQMQIQLEVTKQQLGLGVDSPYREVKEYKEYDIELSDKVKYRTKTLPFAYDDMGNPKKYTEEEKKALKGEGDDRKLEGYKADGVKIGQEVTVTLAKNKETDNKLRGTFVLITKDSDELVKDDKKPRRKNK